MSSNYFTKLNDELMLQNKLNHKLIPIHLWLMEHMGVNRGVCFTVEMIMEDYNFSRRTYENVVRTLKELVDCGLWKAKETYWDDSINNNKEIDWSQIKKNDTIIFGLVSDVKFSNWANRWFMVRYEDICMIQEHCNGNPCAVENMIFLLCWCIRQKGIWTMQSKQEKEINKRWKEKQKRLESEGNIEAHEILEGIKEEDDEWEKEWGISSVQRTRWNGEKEGWFKAFGVKIEEDTGISKTGVISYLGELQKCGLIEIRCVRSGKKSIRWIRVR